MRFLSKSVCMFVCNMTALNIINKNRITATHTTQNQKNAWRLSHKIRNKFFLVNWFLREQEHWRVYYLVCTNLEAGRLIRLSLWPREKKSWLRTYRIVPTVFLVRFCVYRFLFYNIFSNKARIELVENKRRNVFLM